MRTQSKIFSKIYQFEDKALEGRNLRIHSYTLFTDWHGIILYIGLNNSIFSCSISCLLLEEMLQILSNFLNIDEYFVKFVDISEYTHIICTLVQSHLLDWHLEPAM